jgi:hypothetical protein
MNANTLRIETITEDQSEDKRDLLHDAEALQELADIELAYVGGGTAIILFS